MRLIEENINHKMETEVIVSTTLGELAIMFVLLGRSTDRIVEDAVEKSFYLSDHSKKLLKKYIDGGINGQYYCDLREILQSFEVAE